MSIYLAFLSWLCLKDNFMILQINQFLIFLKNYTFIKIIKNCILVMFIKRICCLTSCLVILNQAQASSTNPVFRDESNLDFLTKILEREDPKIFSEMIFRLYLQNLSKKESLKSPNPKTEPRLNFEKTPTPETISNSDIEEEPTKKIPAPEKLNLFNSMELDLNNDCFIEIFYNLKELGLNSCNMSERNWKALSELQFLEKLNISNCVCNDISSRYFCTVLKKLKHFTISNCKLNGKTLELIYSNASNLEYLDFSQNDLSNFPFKNENIFSIIKKKLKRSNFPIKEKNVLPVFKKSLKVLKLANCNLISSDLKKFFIFDNLKEIDLSGNYFSGIDEKVIEKLFGFEKSSSSNQTLITKDFHRTSSSDENAKSQYEAHTSQLKVIDLENCEIKSGAFIMRLFDLENLESLNISENEMKFNFDQIFQGRAYTKLKNLNVERCGDLSIKNLSKITNFPNLQVLNASWNYFINLPKKFRFGCSRESLKELIISGSNLNKHGLKAITDCPNLQVLKASWNNFECLPKGFELGCSKESLRELEIHQSRLNIYGLKAITDCPNLEILRAGLNSFDDLNDELELGRSKNSLKELMVSESLLDSFALGKIAECHQLEILDFSKNRISQEIAKTRILTRWLYWKLRKFSY